MKREYKVFWRLQDHLKKITQNSSKVEKDETQKNFCSLEDRLTMRSPASSSCLAISSAVKDKTNINVTIHRKSTALNWSGVERADV